MDQFSSQLANRLENGYTDGVPEHLIQVYKELSAWCELIQYKIDVDINSQDDIRKQVLSNNLLKHIQGLWQEKVNEFYAISRDEARDNLSKAFQNRISNCHKMIDEAQDIVEENNYQGVYAMPTNEEYFNDNDSLSSEEDYYQKLDEMPDNSMAKNDPSKMVVVVKYNADSMMNNNQNITNFYDEYEFDYGNGNDNYDYGYGYDEYDDYDLHHYKEANVSKVSINYAYNNEERNDMMNNYGNSFDFDVFERPATPSLPDWPSYEEDPNINSCAADYLSNTWESINDYYNAFQNGVKNEQLSYTEQIMKEKVAREEEKDREKENQSYTEQLMKEQKRLSYVSFGSIEMDDYEEKNSICSIKNYEVQQEILESEDTNNNESINDLTKEFASLSIKSNNNEIGNEESMVNQKLYIDDLGRGRIENNGIVEGEIAQNKFIENINPKTVKSSDICDNDYDHDNPLTNSNGVVSSGVLLYTEDPSNLEVDKQQKSNKEEKTKEKLLLNTNIELPPPLKNDIEKEQEIFKYLHCRRDSGFSETCYDTLNINV